MRQTTNFASGNRHSLTRFECPHVDKTFPELTVRLRKADSYDNREETKKTTMKEYEKKFYKDQIRFLLSKFQKMEIKAKKQESEIERMRRQMQKMHQVKRSYSQIEFESEFYSQNDQERSSEAPSVILSTRFKGNSDAKTFQAKSEYERKLNKLQKQYESELKSIRFEHQRKIIKMEIEMQEFRKQKRYLQKQLKQVKQLQNVDGARDHQSLKEENALLRSYIEKEMENSAEKMEKLEQSRMRERMQFVEETKTLQSENKKLNDGLDCLKTFYQQKLKDLQDDMRNKMLQKEQQLMSLQQENQRLLKGQSGLTQMEQKLSNEPMQEKTQIRAKSETQLVLSVRDTEPKQKRSEVQLQLVNQKKQMKMQSLCKQVEERRRNQEKYFKQIERLRIERNQIALQNTQMQQKINILTEELRHVRRQKQRKKQDASEKRVSSFDIDKDIGQVEQFNVRKSQQMKDRVKELQEQVQKEKERNAAVELFYKGRENSLRLSKQMAEHSYKEIWEKQNDMLEKLNMQKSKSLQLERQINDVEPKLKESLQRVQQIEELRLGEKEIMAKQLESQRHKVVCLQKQLLLALEERDKRCGQLQQVIDEKTGRIEEMKSGYEEQMKVMAQKWEDHENVVFLKDQQIDGLKLSKKQLQQQKLQKEMGYDEMISEYKLRQVELLKKIEILEESMVEMRVGFNKVVEDRERIIMAMKDQKDKNEFKNVMKAKQNPNLLLESKMHRSFVQKDRISIQQKVEQYQQQILQINYNHQQEIDHLKAYICELLNDNERLNENYVMAANSWKQMFEGALKYNNFLDQGHQQFEICTSRKNKIEMDLELSKSRRQNLKFSKLSKVSQWSRIVDNTQSKNHGRPLSGIQVLKNQEDKQFSCGIKSEIYEVPDFSERKPFQKPAEKSVMSDFKTGEGRMNRNISQQIEDQLKLSYQRANEGQENVNESNFDLKSVQNRDSLKSKTNEDL